MTGIPSPPARRKDQKTEYRRQSSHDADVIAGPVERINDRRPGGTLFISEILFGEKMPDRPEHSRRDAEKWPGPIRSCGTPLFHDCSPRIRSITIERAWRDGTCPTSLETPGQERVLAGRRGYLSVTSASVKASRNRCAGLTDALAFAHCALAGKAGSRSSAGAGGLGG